MNKKSLIAPKFMSVKLPIELEFPIKSSPSILWNCISTPSGLSQWFADKVNVRGDKHMIFIWEGEERETIVTKNANLRLIKFTWTDEEDKDTATWSLMVDIDELTNDVVLRVNDFVEPGEEDDVQDLWASQVDDLKASIGA